MLVALYIFVDDEFNDPIYADPGAEDLEDGLWERICEMTNDAIEGDQEPESYVQFGEYVLAWRHTARIGLTFVAVVTDDVKAQSVEAYLKDLSRRYLDEVDDVRNPEREGVADVVIDVIPSWEDDG